MAKVVSTQSANKYAGQNSMVTLFCYESVELRDVLWEPWFIDGLSMLAKENATKKYAKKCCMIMSPEDNNCPFILSNLMFAHFSNFITQIKVCRGKCQGKAMCLGKPSYEQPQSALKHLFCMSKYTMQPGFFENLKQFTKGIRRHVANKKAQEGDVSIIGKSKKKRSFDVYKKICELF